MRVSLSQAKGLFKQLSKTFSQCTKNKLPKGYTYNPTDVRTIRGCGKVEG